MRSPRSSEVDTALASDRWAILNSGSDNVKHRGYVGGALRHCCLLLAEIEEASRVGRELTVRIVGRTHIEAWLRALYLHFGGQPALVRIAQDTLHQLHAMHQHVALFDHELADQKRTNRKRLKKVRVTNAGISQWNAEHPEAPKPLHDEPYVPQLAPSGVDLADQIAEFGDLQPRDLPVLEVVDALTKLGPKKGFGNESFTPIYHIYRLLSGGGMHPTLNVYESYLLRGHFTRIAPQPAGPSMIWPTRVMALYSTAFLVGWVLSDAGDPAPIAHELRRRLQPDPNGQASWAPDA